MVGNSKQSGGRGLRQPQEKNLPNPCLVQLDGAGHRHARTQMRESNLDELLRVQGTMVISSEQRNSHILHLLTTTVHHCVCLGEGRGVALSVSGSQWAKHVDVEAFNLAERLLAAPCSMAD